MKFSTWTSVFFPTHENILRSCDVNLDCSLSNYNNYISVTSMNYKDDEESGLFQYGDAIVKYAYFHTYNYLMNSISKSFNYFCVQNISYRSPTYLQTVAAYGRTV